MNRVSLHFLSFPLFLSHSWDFPTSSTSIHPSSMCIFYISQSSLFFYIFLCIPRDLNILGKSYTTFVIVNIVRNLSRGRSPCQRVNHVKSGVIYFSAFIYSCIRYYSYVEPGPNIFIIGYYFGLSSFCADGQLTTQNSKNTLAMEEGADILKEEKMLMKNNFFMFACIIKNLEKNQI